MEKDKKIIIGAVITIIVVFCVAGVLSSNLISAGPVKIVNMEQTLFSEDEDDTAEVSYRYVYGIDGVVKNIPQNEYNEAENYVINTKFYDENNTLVGSDRVENPYIDESIDLGYYESKSPINMSKAEIEISNPNGETIYKTNYTFNMALFEEGEPYFYNETEENSTAEETSTEDTDSDWKTVTMLYPHVITVDDGEIYYDGYSFSFQIEGDDSASSYYIPDSLYNEKFVNYATNSQIKIKYHAGTFTANNGATYDGYIVDDVTTA